MNYTMNRRAIRDLAAKELGLRTAKYFYAKTFEEFKNAADEIGFPCVVKPLMSSSGHGQSYVHNDDELMEAYKEAMEEGRGDVKEVIDGLNKTVKKHHMKRLRKGKCTIELGLVLSDLAMNYERVSDHCSNIAVYLMQLGDTNLEEHRFTEQMDERESAEFNIGAILSVAAVYLVSATETIGDTSALCNSALGRNPHKVEMGKAISCDGFVSSLSGIFGCTPITSFSQNVGLAAMSKVVNRFTIGIGAIIMIIGGVFPVIGYALTTIPQAVLGGCTIMMFGSILYAGFGMMARSGFSQRNMIILSLSLSVGLGL